MDGFSLFTWKSFKFAEEPGKQEDFTERHGLVWSEAHRRMTEWLENGDTEYACPDCESTGSLHVVVCTNARLRQSSDGNIETEVEGDHEWDDESRMNCTHCGRAGKVAEFCRNK